MLKMLQPPTNWLLMRDISLTGFPMDDLRLAFLHYRMMSSVGNLPSKTLIHFSEHQYYAILIKPQFRPKDGQN